MSAPMELEPRTSDALSIDEPIAYIHTTHGLRAVGPDGWPIDDPDDDYDDDQLASGGEVIDVEPVLVVDIEATG